MTESEAKRRKSLLATIAFEPAIGLTRLRAELDVVHGIVASLDLIRADIDWLVEMGFIRFNGELAQITERGRDVAALRAKFPGA